MPPTFPQANYPDRTYLQKWWEEKEWVGKEYIDVYLIRGVCFWDSVDVYRIVTCSL